MAIAGLHNVSVFDSDTNRTGTRAPSLLQLWRELEGEHVVNHSSPRAGERPQQQRTDSSNPQSATTYLLHGGENVNGNDNLALNDDENECGTYPQSPVGSENEHEDNNSVISEQSADLGEAERQRVRQVFRGWMSNGAKDHSLNVPHRNNLSRSQWLGENERGRVRVIMDWVQVNCQQRGTCPSPTDDGASETGSQIDGSLGNHCEIGERKAIRKLCGRQALLDLLEKSQRERKKELQELLEQRRVSNFSHRNRIQALLRGRFLRNGIVAHDERPTSRARSELGFLRQRHAVSNLREEFLSKVDDSVRVSQNSSNSDTSSNADHDGQRLEQFQAEDGQEVLDEAYDLFGPSDEEREGNGFPAEGNLERDLIGEPNQHASTSHAVKDQLQVVSKEIEQVHNLYFTNGGEGDNSASGSLKEIAADERVEETLAHEASAEGHLEDAREVFLEQGVRSTESNHVHEVDGGQVEDLEVHATEDLDWQETSDHVEEWRESAVDHEGGWQQLSNVVAGEGRDGDEGGPSGIWQEGGDNHWNQDNLDNDFGQPSHIQEPQDDWHGNDLQEAIDSWLDVPSGEEVGSIRRDDAFYFAQDNNVYSMELRELLSRRRVSGLLRSGFRASLDQLIQSYVERQGNASLDWEQEGTSSPPAFIEPDQEQQNGSQEQNDNQSGGIDTISSSARASHPLWDQALPDGDWSLQNTHNHLGIEWEVISELRIDLVRLHHRMNNMQRMLEACMDMQLELQRAVRQEVSAALNRPIVSEGHVDVSKDHGPNDEAKWDCVRKGICCLCSEHSINALLYRCGHMCTCTSCAENLVQRKEKCPMCQAPIVEVIRAYSTQS